MVSLDDIFLTGLIKIVELFTVVFLARAMEGLVVRMVARLEVVCVARLELVLVAIWVTSLVVGFVVEVSVKFVNFGLRVVVAVNLTVLLADGVEHVLILVSLTSIHVVSLSELGLTKFSLTQL